VIDFIKHILEQRRLKKELKELHYEIQMLSRDASIDDYSKARIALSLYDKIRQVKSKID
jgi:hypothetical protein